MSGSDPDDMEMDDGLQGGAYYKDYEGLASDKHTDLTDVQISPIIQCKVPPNKRKRGIIYISNIPKHLNVTILREILSDYGRIGRIYLQPATRLNKQSKKKRKRYNIQFTEGWVEFESKSVAKQIVPMLNNTQISTRKRSPFYDSLWSMKYLPRFKWVHLTERMNYELAVQKQRLRTEVSQARKETTFFQNNLDKSESLNKQAKKAKKAAKKEKKETSDEGD